MLKLLQFSYQDRSYEQRVANTRKQLPMLDLDYIAEMIVQYEMRLEALGNTEHYQPADAETRGTE